MVSIARRWLAKPVVPAPFSILVMFYHLVKAMLKLVNHGLELVTCTRMVARVRSRVVALVVRLKRSLPIHCVRGLPVLSDWDHLLDDELDVHHKRQQRNKRIREAVKKYARKLHLKYASEFGRPILDTSSIRDEVQEYLEQHSGEAGADDDRWKTRQTKMLSVQSQDVKRLTKMLEEFVAQGKEDKDAAKRTAGYSRSQADRKHTEAGAPSARGAHSARGALSAAAHRSTGEAAVSAAPTASTLSSRAIKPLSKRQSARATELGPVFEV